MNAAPTQNETLLSCLQRLLTARGLRFSDWQIASFYTALQAKGFVILGGPSGMGKTRLAQHFATLLPQPAEGNNWLFVAVRPEWRESAALLGRVAPNGVYEWTPFLRFLLRAVQSYEQGDGLAWFVILDEMNLACVEHYLAEFLSVLESGWEEDGWTREPLRLEGPAGMHGESPPRQVRLPPNLYLIGTLNADETSYSLSTRILDRAFTLELDEADFTDYLTDAADDESEPNESEGQRLLSNLTFDGTFTGHGYTDKHFIRAYLLQQPQVRMRLQTLNNLLRPYHFGYRAFDEIVGFLDAAEYNALFEGLGGAEAAFDAAVLMKVAPRLKGGRAALEAPLRGALAWCVNPDAPAMPLITQALATVSTVGEADRALGQLAYCYPRTAAHLRRKLCALHLTAPTKQV